MKAIYLTKQLRELEIDNETLQNKVSHFRKIKNAFVLFFLNYIIKCLGEYLRFERVEFAASNHGTWFI
jgi:hypothetical protein